MRIKTFLILPISVAFFTLPLFAQGTPVAPLPSVPEDVAKTHLLRYKAPTYPSDAKRNCIEGDVVLELVISETGTVWHSTVLRGPALLTDSAVTAARKWVYDPYILGGKPVRYLTQATVHFRLPKSECPHRMPS